MSVSPYDHPGNVSYRLILLDRLSTPERTRVNAWAEDYNPPLHYGVSLSDHDCPGGVITTHIFSGDVTLPEDLTVGLKNLLGRPIRTALVPLSPADRELFYLIVDYARRRNAAEGRAV